MAEQKCIGDHTVHICELAKAENFAKIKELAKEPYYMCFNCGRLADQEKNLCNPIAIDRIGVGGI
jgi:hypothetical protein